jgi:hypothetical protein
MVACSNEANICMQQKNLGKFKLNPIVSNIIQHSANMLIQHHQTLLDATCWPRLITMLDDVRWG